MPKCGFPIQSQTEVDGMLKRSGDRTDARRIRMLNYALSVSLVNKHLRKGVELIFHHAAKSLIRKSKVLEVDR